LLTTPAAAQGDVSFSLGSNTTVFCTGENAVVSIGLSDVSSLFGYQFILHYDPDLVGASGAFINTFFDASTQASVPGGWSATCSSGTCRFAASKVEPGAPVSGSGMLAQVTLTGIDTGLVNLTLSEDILSDRDARPIAHTTTSLELTVCGYASLSGTVALQGRDTPFNAGQVTLTDADGIFGPYTASFSPSTGAFSFSNVKVMPAGTNYRLDAIHGLYLGSRTTHTLRPLDTYAAPATRLKGGDADNSGLIDISDLTCIGGSFDSTPVICGTTGSSDINADGKINILDLVLAGSNYGLSAPQGW